jgi:hypothetical protein
MTAFVAGVLVFMPALTFIAAIQVIATARAGVPLSALGLLIVIVINVAFVWLPFPYRSADLTAQADRVQRLAARTRADPADAGAAGRRGRRGQAAQVHPPYLTIGSLRLPPASPPFSCLGHDNGTILRSTNNQPQLSNSASGESVRR